MRDHVIIKTRRLPDTVDGDRQPVVVVAEATGAGGFEIGRNRRI